MKILSADTDAKVPMLKVFQMTKNTKEQARNMT